MSDVLLVVANAAVLSPGDTALRNFLTGAGHTVTLISDETLPIPSGMDVIVVSESVSPGVMTAYRDLSTPMVTFEGNICDDVGMTTNGTNTVNSGSAQIVDLIENAHPIVEGLSDPAQWFSVNGGMWGFLPAQVCPGAVTFLRNDGQTHILGFAVDVGAELWTGLAKRRLCYLTGTDASADDLTPAVGQVAFLQAVAWAAYVAPEVVIPPSSGILTAMDTVTDQLSSVGGLRASQDISKVNAPGVWVTLQDVRPEFMNGDGTVALYLYLIAPNVAFRDTVRLLDELLGKVSAVVPTEGDIQPVSLVVSDGKATLPAWRVTSLATYQRET